MIGNCCKLTAIHVAGNPFVDETWGRFGSTTRNRSKVGLPTAGVKRRKKGRPCLRLRHIISVLDSRESCGNISLNLKSFALPEA